MLFLSQKGTSISLKSKEIVNQIRFCYIQWTDAQSSYNQSRWPFSRSWFQRALFVCYLIHLIHVFTVVWALRKYIWVAFVISCRYYQICTWDHLTMLLPRAWIGRKNTKYVSSFFSFKVAFLLLPIFCGTFCFSMSVRMMQLIQLRLILSAQCEYKIFWVIATILFTTCFPTWNRLIR